MVICRYTVDCRIAGSVTLGPGGTTRLLADSTHVAAGLQGFAGSPAASVELDPLASPGETFVPGSDAAGMVVAASSAGGTLVPSTLPATLVTGGVSVGGSAGSSVSPAAVQSALRAAPVPRVRQPFYAPCNVSFTLTRRLRQACGCV